MQSKNLPADKVRKEIVALETFTRAAINISSGDRLGAGQLIRVDRLRERYRRRRAAPGEWIGALPEIPPVIGSGLPDVDFFPDVLAHVGDIKISQSTVEARTPGVAQAQGPDFIG